MLDRLCSDAELIRSMWNRYDEKEMGSKVISLLVTALKRLVTEKPALLGVCTQMGGVGVHSDPSPSPSGTGASGAAAYGLDMAGRVASATVSGVVGMIGGTGGLSLHGSSMKLQWYVLYCSQTCRDVNPGTALISWIKQMLLQSPNHTYISWPYSALSRSVRALHHTLAQFIAT